MLAIDVGNTFAKWRIDFGDGQQIQGRCLTKDMVTEAHILLSKYGVNNVFVSWVGASSDKNEFVSSIRSKGLRCHLLQSQREMNGLFNGYSDYQRLGVDRWLAMLAVWTKYRKAFCVVDAGTALTIDIVNRNGRHVGGYILPGYRTSISSLNKATALINTEQDGAAVSELLPATNTADAVRRGALLSMAGGIEYALQHYNFDGSPGGTCEEKVCVLGGGDAGLLGPLLSRGWVLNEEVVLDGIVVCARAIKQQS